MKRTNKILFLLALLIAGAAAWAFRFQPSCNDSSEPSAEKAKTILPGHGHEVRSVVFSPDGKVLASGSKDGTVKLWDALTGEPLRTINGHEGEDYNAIAFSADGSILALTSPDETVNLHEASSGKLLRTLAQCRILGNAAFSSDGAWLATGSGNNVRLWNPQAGTIARTLIGHSKSVTGLAFSADGKTLVSGGDDEVVKIWEAQTGKLLRTIPNKGDVTRVAVSPDGKTLAVAGFNVIKFWNAQTGELNRSVKAGADTFPEGPTVYSISYSPDGETLAVAAYDFHLALIDGQTGKRKFDFLREVSHSSSVTISPDGKLVAAGGDRKTIMVWSLETAKLQYQIGTGVGVQAVAFSPDGKLFANDCGFFFEAVNLREAQTGKLIRTLGGHDSALNQLTFSPDGKILCGAQDGAIYLWDVETGELRHKLEEKTSSVTFSPDSRTLASNGNYANGMLKLWDVESGELKRSITASAAAREKNLLTNKLETIRLGVECSHFSADGETLAALVDSGLTLKFWNTKTGALLRQVKLPSQKAGFGIFSPDGKLLMDESFNVRDAATGKLLCSLGEANFRRVAAFSPQAIMIATSTEGELTMLWDAKTGRLIKALRGHAGEVNAIAFSPDGKTVLTGSDDGTVKLWDTQSGEAKLTVVIPEAEAKANP